MKDLESEHRKRVRDYQLKNLEKTRTNTRNRYRRKAGIPLDAPLAKVGRWRTRDLESTHICPLCGTKV